MNKLQTVYQWVKASEEMPARDYKGIIRSDFGLIMGTSWFYRQVDSGHLKLEQWSSLQPTQAILITQEEWDAYNKCIELLEEISRDEYAQPHEAAKQLLTQLNNQL